MDEDAARMSGIFGSLTLNCLLLRYMLTGTFGFDEAAAAVVGIMCLGFWWRFR